MAMSRIRHLVLGTQPDARNSSGDENAREAKPNSFSKSGSDSRTDSSSSTTDTSKRVTVIDFSCRAHSRRLRQRYPGVFALSWVRKSTCPVRECCPYQSGQRIDETVLRDDLFSAALHNTRVRASGGTVYCTLVLVCQSEAKKSSRMGTSRCKAYPLATPVTARTGHPPPRAPGHPPASVTSGVRMPRLLSVAVAPSDACGTENENVAPGPLFSVAHSRP